MGSRPAKAEAVLLEEPVLLSQEGVQDGLISEPGLSDKKEASGSNDAPKATNENTLETQTTSKQSSPRDAAVNEDLADSEKMSPDIKKSANVEPAKAPKAKKRPLTEADVPSIINLARSKSIEMVENYSFETHRENDIVRKNLLALKQVYFEFRNFPPEKATKYRRAIGIGFVETGLIPILAEIAKDYLTTGWCNEEGKEDLKAFYRLYNSFILLFNYSDSCPAIAEAAADVEGFFEFIREQLKLYFPKHMDETSLTKCEETMVRNLLGFTHNCSAVGRARRRQHELGYTEVLIPYLNSRIERFKMSTVLSLANIVDEKESEILNTSHQAVRFLLKSLGKATKDKTRRHMGWSAKELAHGVGRLASNDSNKKLLVTEGALPLLLDLATVGDEEDQSEAVGALWALSFLDDNKDSLIAESGLIDKVVELSKSPVLEVKKAAQGVLWTCRYKLKETSGYESVGEKLIGPDVVSSHSVEDSWTETGNHVMISYQWDSQAVLLRVRDALKDAGYRTWMDIDFMGGSTLQAMAEAVESSAAVLVCMSQRYKDSPNCRAEAEYAFQRRVPIVPLLMEPGYRPDGWLGILLGSKLFYDFSGKYSFETRFSGLIKELGPKGIAGSQGNSSSVKPEVPKHRDDVDSGQIAIIPPVRSGILSAAPPSEQKSAREITNWGKADIEKWLKKNELERSGLSVLTGKQLLFLRDLKVEAPETFYSILRTNLGLSSLEDLMTFTQALVSLV